MEYLLAWRMAVAKGLLRRHEFGLAEITKRVDALKQQVDELDSAQGALKRVVMGGDEGTLVHC